jgi:hypothetical protein
MEEEKNKLDSRPEVAETEVDPYKQAALEETTFKDKLISFAILALPWSVGLWLLMWLTSTLEPRFANIFLLVGIVGFLFAVGWLARRIKRFREARSRAS